MRETEIHVKLSEKENLKFKKKLRKMGFKDLGVTIQHDRIFNEDCFKEGVKIRIRTEDNKAEITCKSKTDYSTGLQDRVEVNVSIKKEEVEKFLMIFEMLGYKVFYQILKKRHKFEKDGIEVTFDSFPLIDELVEIEGEKERIEEFVEKVLPNVDRQTFTYKEHIEFKMHKTGKTFEELKKQFEDEHNFKLMNLGKIFDN